MSDLASVLVSALEGSDARSTAALRHAAYKALEPFVDVPKLVAEARASIAAELKARADKKDLSEERMRAAVASIPELQAVVEADRRMADQIRQALRDGWHVDDITAKLGTTRPFVRAVRALDHARACKAKLKDAPRNKARERLERILSRKAWVGDPTRERVRQAGGEKPEEIKVAGEMRAHRFHWPVDLIKQWLGPEEYAAAQAFRDAYEGMGGRSKVADWGGGSAGNPATKLALSPEQERCARDFQVFVKGLGSRSMAFAVATNFILGEPVRGNVRALSFVEWGDRYAGVAEKQARGIAQGLLWMVCADLAEIRRVHDRYVQQERRAVLRAIGGDRRLSALIAAGSHEKAIAILCNGIPVKHWIIRATVYRLVNEARRKAAEEAAAAAEARANHHAASSAA